MVLQLIIDGYNLAAALWGMGKSGPVLERQRNELVALLVCYREQRPHDIHVVFDGWRSGDPLGHRTRDRGILITFSPKGVTADEVIHDLLEEDGGAGIVVVSGDRRIQGWARNAGSEPVESWAFVERLTTATAASLRARKGTGRAGEPGDSGEDTGGEDDADDGWSGDTKKRGNPRRQSRRQRALDRQLKKL
ncbi:MAG: NYN domain-containing protein [Nitrospirota bacterium]|nr:NYN domain-containing protein [Nitrospirota bacterium]